jgi:sugar O-acyltransferase (sialic acid O-acetyltransferase NeuD family)
MSSILILGGGGHAKVLLDCLLPDKKNSILGILEVDPQLVGKTVLGIPVIGCEEDILQNYSPSSVQLVNGVGSVCIAMQRKKIFDKFKKSGYSFVNVIHPTAYIGEDVFLGEGVQLMAGSIVQPGSRIGNNVIVNTQSTIDHDCAIGDDVHLAPGVICCGDVIIGNGTHVGCGAVLLQGVKIGEQCLIAAGAVVVHDINIKSKVAGIPARSME